MDLWAYANIEELEALLSSNGIDVPRLRGLRLMSRETPITSKEIKEMVSNFSNSKAENVICRVSPRITEYSSRTAKLRERYLVYEDSEPVAIRWDLLHGKRRKEIKFAIRKMKKAIEKQYEVWNRYAGRPHILYIHARIGGNNWDYYGGSELKKQPWFLEAVNDCYDDTYCDIYAYIREDK